MGRLSIMTHVETTFQCPALIGMHFYQDSPALASYTGKTNMKLSGRSSAQQLREGKLSLCTKVIDTSLAGGSLELHELDPTGEHSTAPCCRLADSPSIQYAKGGKQHDGSMYRSEPTQLTIRRFDGLIVLALD